MVEMKLLPHTEGEPEKTDVQIIEAVLKEQSSSSGSTFLTRLGVASSSRKSSISVARIRELEDRLADQEQQSIEATERYHQEMDAKLKARDEKFEELRKKQEEEIEALKNAQAEKTLAYEKRQQEMDAVLSLLLRQSSQNN